MAWTTVPTFTSGQILTAAQMNGIGTDLNELRGDWAAFRRSAGSVTLTGTTNWSDLTTIGTSADLVLAADAGDVVEFVTSIFAFSEAVDLGFDAVTVVGGVVTNSFALNGAAVAAFSGNNGISSWWCPASRLQPFGSGAFYKLVSGDISSGTVTLRLRYAMGAATNRQILATTANPFHIWARNHGPVEI